MRRLTAIALVLLAVAITFVPIAKALADSSDPSPHACCQRKSAHPCHGSTSESEELVIHDAGCCNHQCCRAVNSSQRANTQPSVSSLLDFGIESRATELHVVVPNREAAAFCPSRAPPAC